MRELCNGVPLSASDYGGKGNREFQYPPVPGQYHLGAPWPPTKKRLCRQSVLQHPYANAQHDLAVAVWQPLVAGETFTMELNFKPLNIRPSSIPLHVILELFNELSPSIIQCLNFLGREHDLLRFKCSHHLLRRPSTRNCYDTFPTCQHPSQANSR